MQSKVNVYVYKIYVKSKNYRKKGDKGDVGRNIGG